MVLVVSMAVIVAGGLGVPFLWTLTTPGERAAVSSASGAETALKDIPSDALAIADKLSELYRAAAGRVSPAVVAVSTSATVTEQISPFGDLPDDMLRKFFGQEMPGFGPQSPPQKFERRGLGSGVIVDAEGYILTNNHVVKDAQDIKVHLQDGRDFKAKVNSTDPMTDVAVIKIEATHLPTAELGDSDKMQPGDLVIAIGAPFGLEWTVTAGIVSATSRHGVGVADYESFIQTDAAINPGNSGGPLINTRGQVIGLNTAIASQSGGYQGVGFAVPSNLARQVMEQLRKTGEVVRGWLGVSIQKLTPELAESMKLKATAGVLVSQALEGGPAEKAGLKTGDVIVEFGGKPVKSPDELQTAVAWTAPGTKVDVVVMRDGKRVDLKVTVEKRAAGVEMAAAPGAPSALKDLGIQVSGITPDAIQKYGYKPGQGVLITKVDPGGLGDMAGLKAGMLILKVGDQAVKSVAELETAMGKVDLAKGVPLLVRSGQNQIFVLLKKQ